jgi:hypothetical protein
MRSDAGDPSAPYDHDEKFAALVESMRRVRPLALVGAGASVDSGYPTWERLLKDLEDEVVAKKPQAVAPKHISVVRDLQDPAWQAEEFFNLLGPDLFHGFIERTFGPPDNGVAEPHHLIAKIGFRHILTTNFEPCAELALEAATGKQPDRVNWSDVAKVRQFFADLTQTGADPSVVYLHGYASEPANVVLTETGYTNAYLREENRRRLIALFMTQPIVFIGFSMNDPDLGQIMREVLFSLPDRIKDGTVAATDDSGPLRQMRHFGLFGYRTSDERDLIRRRMQGKFGLQTVFYRMKPMDDGKRFSHDNLLDLLRAIHTEVRRPGAVAKYPAPVKVPTTRTLKSVVPVASAFGMVFDENVYDIDPNKGQFGGTASADGYVLRAANLRERRDWMQFDLVVQGTRHKRLNTPVTFHYHPTFDPRFEVIEPARNKAQTTVKAVGAFTVGVQVGGTRLELDLADDERFPLWFRQS